RQRRINLQRATLRSAFALDQTRRRSELFPVLAWAARPPRATVAPGRANPNVRAQNQAATSPPCRASGCVARRAEPAAAVPSRHAPLPSALGVRESALVR